MASVRLRIGLNPCLARGLQADLHTNVLYGDPQTVKRSAIRDALE